VNNPLHNCVGIRLGKAIFVTCSNTTILLNAF
jgi:hypothetical protein